MISGNFVDSLVLRALRDDDEKALEHLFQSYYNRLFRMSLKLHPDSELAKECVQEVFNELWHYRKTVAEIESFEAYLKTALKRRIFKKLTRLRKKKAKDEAFFSEQEIEVPSWEEVIIEQQAQNVDQEKIRGLINQLTPRQKEIVVLKYFEEMNYAQIAVRTGLQTDTIYKILHEAIKRMKSLVGLPT